MTGKKAVLGVVLLAFIGALSLRVWLGGAREFLPRTEVETLIGMPLPAGQLYSYYYKGLLMVKIEGDPEELKSWSAGHLPELEPGFRPASMDFALKRPWWDAPEARSTAGCQGEVEAMLSGSKLYLSRRQIKDSPG